MSFSRAAVRQVEMRCRDLLRPIERRRIAVRTYHAFALDLLRAHGRLLTGSSPQILYPAAVMLAKVEFDGDWSDESRRMASEDGRYAFEELASSAERILSGSHAVAELVANKYPLIILDEFQDTNESQWDLVKALSAGSKMIFLADPDQRIFDYDPGVSPARLDELRERVAPDEFDLRGENYRSPDSGVLEFADAVLHNRPLPGVSNVATRTYWPRNFDSEVHLAVIQMLYTLRKSGISQPSVVVLATTNKLVANISTVLTGSRPYGSATLPPIDHDVLWDADLTAAAALVVASVLEWPGLGEQAAAASTLDRIADYFNLKNALSPSISARDMSAKYRLASARARAGVNQTLKSAKALIAACGDGLELHGAPAQDWVTARDLLSVGADFDEILANARYVRLFRATDEIGSRLADSWDQHASYGRATDLVRRALDAGRLQSEQRDPRGCVLMTIHKAKGKEFDGVVLVEGHHQGVFFRDGASARDVGAMRRLLRVAITRSRRHVVIVRANGANPLVTP